tara:strand:+ start:1762 stop:2697 length:936 start_codon:yes stop_codon:yes gene_type:complete
VIKKFKKVLVVLGGTSGERSVSLDSGKACVKALKKKKYSVSTFDPKFQNYNLINKNKIDAIFNALHGKNGEDGIAQTYFEYLKIPYTHSGVLSSYYCMNKLISKKIFKKYKISTPKFFKISLNSYNKKTLKKKINQIKLTFPIVVKPINEGSSLGVKISKNIINLDVTIKNLLKKYDELMIEQFIGGQEIQVAVINNVSIGAIELEPKRSFYDYKAKYSKTAKTKHIMPARLNKKNYSEALRLALKAHKALNCRGISRADFKFYNNKFYLLEINTQPGMTKLSLAPEIASYYGIDFPNLVEKILSDASVNK